ncbi:MAG: hypothetical protein GFH27_549325n74 [Chloroflexi bacterium AL-W]|nr:hypothetical protein [Chloroflexi bacterium AL-N1]NOK70076.1 hypothetical protein [Chloroflexi bacterium AL-N10]NOK77912.1 hypothetical protein [Chloroflexi bacterium AL-N5]NOK84921.1 hypothetical protein [Chloroflexi bacterium AL-W]NOK91900.1 hypothetical protein [Chloroflexi bacterium AL-N15]
MRVKHLAAAHETLGNRAGGPGLYARWLFRRIGQLGWQPFLRIHTGAKFWPTGTGSATACRPMTGRGRRRGSVAKNRRVTGFVPSGMGR